MKCFRCGVPLSSAVLKVKVWGADWVYACEKHKVFVANQASEWAREFEGKSVKDRVAVILNKSSGGSCALALAPWDRQVDVFKLARMGNAVSRRMWDDFSRELPSDARLVADFVGSQDAARRKATDRVDKRLVKAEKPKVVKTRKGKRKSGVPVERVAGLSFVNSPNPVDREAARKLLGL